MAELDRPLSLKQVCELIFTNTISVATLKAEHARGNLDLVKIGRQYFTTRRNLAAMMEKCRLPTRSPASTRGVSQANLTEEARQRASLTALKLSVETLKAAAREKNRRRRAEERPRRAAVKPEGN